MHTLAEHIWFHCYRNYKSTARNLVSQQEFEDELYGFGFDDVCICPHLPSERCDCRKPGTGMLETMIDKYQLDRAAYFVIGDIWSDMHAVITAGVPVILVKTGCGNESLTDCADRWDIGKASYIAADLSDAADRILSQSR